MAGMDAHSPRHGERCSAAGVDSKRSYARHRPQDTVLYQIVERHVEPFFDSMSEQGASLPGFVREEFDVYLRLVVGLNTGSLSQTKYYLST